MKITKTRIRQIIRESLNRSLVESQEIVTPEELEVMRDRRGGSRYIQKLFTELRNLIGEMELYPEGSPQREKAKLSVAAFMYENELYQEFRQIFGHDLEDFVVKNRRYLDLDFLDVDDDY